MIKGLLQDIISYFDLLIGEGYYVAFHNLSIPLQDYMGVLTPYNINSNPYCLLVKSSQEAWNHCIERQEKVIKACCNGPFSGVCYAGMGEYVYPIQGKYGNTLAFISVSGYRIHEDTVSHRIAYIAQKYHLNKQELITTHRRSMQDQPSNVEALSAKIMPLCRMFELLNLLLAELSVNEVESMTRSSILGHAVVYLRRNYAQPINVKEVANVCHCSTSTLSHMFKKELGVSIREYIRNLRMADAMRMLRDTDLPISSISDILGYGNPNYFCNVFSQKAGCSPTDYRQKSKK